MRKQAKIVDFCFHAKEAVWIAMLSLVSCPRGNSNDLRNTICAVKLAPDGALKSRQVHIAL